MLPFLLGSRLVAVYRTAYLEASFTPESDVFVVARNMRTPAVSKTAPSRPLRED